LTFARDTSVARSGPGSYTAEIRAGWDIFGVTNGGYLLAIACRAMTEESEGRSVVSVNGRYVSPAGPGPVVVRLETPRMGRTLTTMHGSVSAGDRVLAVVNASLSTGQGPGGDHHAIHGEPPDLPPPDECVRLVPAVDGSLPPPFSGMVDCRLHPDDATIGQSRPGPPTVRGWFRLLDDEPLDPMGLVLASDGFPPAVFNSDLPLGWTPTIDLTVHVRDPGPHEWVACRFTTRFVTGGWLEEDGEIWDAGGNLVAQSRQLALVAR
jgi:acyl-CoA thioesterase